MAERTDAPEVVATHYTRSGKYGAVALTERQFKPADRDEPIVYLWLEHARPGKRPQGVSIPARDLRGLGEALLRLADERDGRQAGAHDSSPKQSETPDWMRRRHDRMDRGER